MQGVHGVAKGRTEKGQLARAAASDERNSKTTAKTIQYCQHDRLRGGGRRGGGGDLRRRKRIFLFLLFTPLIANEEARELETNRRKVLKRNMIGSTGALRSY